MENQSASKNGSISLPVQTLKWELIKNTKKLRRIYLQFDISLSARNEKTFQGVAYPVYKIKGEWEVGEKIPLEPAKDGRTVELPLPLTLGNLEINYKKIKHCIKTGKEVFTLQPYLYEKNPHAAYNLLDESGQLLASANPCPPGRPSAD